MPSPILIATNVFDPHADVIANMLTRRGFPPHMLHLGDLPLQGTLNTRLDKSAAWSTKITTRRGTIDLADVRAVWWRKVSPFTASPWLPANEKIFVEREGTAALRGTWEALEAARGDIYWMSHPSRQRAAASKIEQLQRAITLGFNVPKTLVSSDPDCVRAFYDDCDGDMIHKSMTVGVIGAFHFGDQPHPSPEKTGPLLTTARVTDVLLRQLDSVTLVPGLFQELVPKRYELRVTVIDEQVFTAAVYSQADERTSMDWRTDPTLDIPWVAASLPDELAERCLEMVRGYGLTFGAFDFIVTPEGEHVFLEMNPNGQWMFVQERVPELRMAQALVDVLIAKSR
ncbi:hypothetical protein [Streptomyces sp. MMBL 11-3]|uniref:hypothetical protein n=1 Tax=Streptomyces sp. MMBL 11-3 TaxID=3382639 RepID=UPI0039B3A048